MERIEKEKKVRQTFLKWGKKFKTNNKKKDQGKKKWTKISNQN